MLHTTSFGPPGVFSLVPVIIFIVFMLIVMTVVVKVIRGVSDWNYNNRQPVLSRKSTVVSKRLEVTGHGDHSSTTYYATFELEDGDRRELKLSGSEYGLLAEGDLGELSFQGSRFLGFERSAEAEVVEAKPAPGPALVCAYCGAQNHSDALKCAGCGSGKLEPATAKAEV